MIFLNSLKACTWIVYSAIWLFFAVNLFFLGREGILLWRSLSRRQCFIASSAAAILGTWGVLLFAGIVVRGGYINENDFSLLSLDFKSCAVSLVRIWDLFAIAGKEISPLAVFSLFDLISGNSLEGILWGQRILWFLSSILIALILRRGGYRRDVCLASAGLFSLNFLALLSANSFSTTYANLFFVLSACLALMAWRAESDPVRSIALSFWFFSAAFLVFTSRFEFMGPLAWGAVLAFTYGKRRLIQEAWSVPAQRRLMAAAGAGFILVYASWAFFLLHTAELLRGSMRWIVDNLNYHLGRQNLEPVLGIPASWYFFLVCAALAAAFVLGFKKRKEAGMFWPLFLFGWIFYFSSAFFSQSLLPLEFVRHHLYFFLPFTFLAGFLLQEMRWVRAALLFPLLMAYGISNALHARRLNPLVRTNDLEWSFLLESRRSWPESCRAVYPLEDSRRKILSKYFPSSGSCLLEYRSPLYQAVYFHELNFRGKPESRPPAWREIRFSHHFYTEWHGPWTSRFEFMDRRPIHAGFYFVKEPPISENSSSSGNISLGHIQPYRLWRTGFVGHYENSLELCHKRIMSSYWRYRSVKGSLKDSLDAQEHSALSASLGCFDRALQDAVELKAGAKIEAELLFSKAAILQALGEKDSARQNAILALQKAPPQWRRSEPARRLIEGP